MKLSRHQFLQLAAGAATLPTVSRLARADTYPSRPVHIVIGFPAGSAADITGRLMGRWLSERLGQPFVIENRPGAGSNIAAEAIVRALPDGYALLYVANTNAVNTTLYTDLKFNFIHDIAAVATINRNPLIMEINPSFPAKTVPDFIRYAKANPGKINMASAGNGTTTHMAGELFKVMADVNLIHVPYRGSPQAITDLLSGQVQVMFDVMASSIEHIKAGTLRALAVTTARRSDALPDIPTVGEFVPGYEAISWGGIGAPKGTPTEIVEKLNKEINVGLTDPNMKARLADLGAEAMSMTSAEFGELIAAETEKWGKLIRAANIKPE